MSLKLGREFLRLLKWKRHYNVTCLCETFVFSVSIQENSASMSSLNLMLKFTSLDFKASKQTKLFSDEVSLGFFVVFLGLK